MSERRLCTGQVGVRLQGLAGVGAREVAAGERKGNWDTVPAGAVGGTGVELVGACQERMAAGVSPRWSRRRASSPAAGAAAAAGIAGGQWGAFGC